MEIDAPAGTRDPVVVHSGNEARAVLIVLNAGPGAGRPPGEGERLGDRARRHACGSRPAASRSRPTPGMLFRFDPDERHSLASDERRADPAPARAVARRGPLPRQRAPSASSPRPCASSRRWYAAPDHGVHEVAERQEEAPSARRSGRSAASVVTLSPAEQEDGDEHQREEEQPALAPCAATTAARSSRPPRLVGLRLRRLSPAFAGGRGDQLLRLLGGELAALLVDVDLFVLVPLQLLLAAAAASSSASAQYAARLQATVPSLTTAATRSPPRW